MRSFVAAFVLAAVVSVLATPLALRFALKTGAISRPGGRNVHAASTPRLGGLAICMAFFAPLIALFFTQSTVAAGFKQETRKLVGLALGGLAMCALGALDDIRGIRAVRKLYAQLLVAALAFACGFRIEAVLLPVVGSVSMGIFALPITTLWIVGIINAVNLIDGLDGLAAGVVFFAGVTNFVVAVVTGSAYVALLMASTLGAVFGFLAYNWNPARIFMGDSGSYFLGFILATTSLAGASQKASTAVSLLVPIVALGVPIFDTLFAMVRRVLQRRSIFSPDRGHIHHRLLDMGLTHRRAVLVIYAVSIVLTIAAIAISLGRAWQAGLAILGASAMLFGLVRFLGYFQYIHPQQPQARTRAPEAERLRHELPRACLSLQHAQTEAELFMAVAQVAEAAELTSVDIARSTGAACPPVYHWEQPIADRQSSRATVTVRYGLGGPSSAGAEIRFGCRSDQSQIAPETEILLRIVADLVAESLVRLQGLQVPRDAVEPRASVAASDTVVAP